MQKVKTKQRKIKLASKHGLHNIKRKRYRLSMKYKELCQKIRRKRKEKQEAETAQLS